MSTTLAQLEADDNAVEIITNTPTNSFDFGSFLLSGDLADVVLVVGQTEYDCHKLILAYHSDYFHSLFTSDFREKDQDRIQLHHDDPENVFPVVLEYLYTGHIEITQTNAIPLLATCDQFLIEALKARVIAFLATKINRDNALELLVKSIQYHAHEVAQKCELVIAKNFPLLVDADFSNLPVDAMIALMKHQNLAVRDEWVVYKSIANYIDSHVEFVKQEQLKQEREAEEEDSDESEDDEDDDEDSEDHTDDENEEEQDGNDTNNKDDSPQQQSNSSKSSPLASSSTENNTTALDHHESGSEDALSTGLSSLSLDPVSAYNLMRPVDLGMLGWTEEHLVRLFEAVRFPFLRYHQLKEAAENPYVPKHLLIDGLLSRLQTSEHEVDQQQDVKFQPRAVFGMPFEYQSDYDGNGIIWWIGTDCKRKPFTNPAAEQKVIVTASSIERGSTEDFVSPEERELWTEDIPSSWFVVDLGPNRSVKPTYYTLRHGAPFAADSLRSWELQGSTDNSRWRLLKKHIKDKALSGQFTSHSWSIKSTKRAYRYFRILQTGHNSSKHNFLAASGFEIYGELFET